MKKMLILLSVLPIFIIACDKSQGIEITKIVMDIIGYIVSAIIGAIGGAKVQKVAIIKDPSNNYTGKKEDKIGKN